LRGPHNIWRLIRTGATFERTGAMKVALEAMEVAPPRRLGARRRAALFGHVADRIQHTQFGKVAHQVLSPVAATDHGNLHRSAL
jgi:hypothetical protein